MSLNFKRLTNKKFKSSESQKSNKSLFRQMTMQPEQILEEQFNPLIS